MTTNRREFLRISMVASGGLLVSCSGRRGAAPTSTDPSPPAPTGDSQPTTSAAPTQAAVEFAPFIEIHGDGLVHVAMPKSEMGQGTQTALAMLVAEELDVDLSAVVLRPGVADPRLGGQVTGGSGGIADGWLPLRQAGAAARALLVDAAARRWSVEPADCTTASGVVAHAPSSRTASYADLLVDVDLTRLGSEVRPATKTSEQFHLIGTSPVRVETDAILAGKRTYGLDVRIDGMRYAVLARSPMLGGTQGTLDDAAAKAVPGVVAVVPCPAGVAVLATDTWSATRGRDALVVEWRPPAGDPVSSSTISTTLDTAMAGLSDRHPLPDGHVLDAVYETGFVPHLTMEPLSCTARIADGRCELWLGTQNPQAVARLVGAAVGLPVDVHVVASGGGFGRRLEVDHAIEAAQVAVAAQATVQLVWTREDDIRHDMLRPISRHRLSAVLAPGDADPVVAWRHLAVGPGHEGLAYRDGQSLLTDGIDVRYGAARHIAAAQVTKFPLRTGPWRGVLSATNALAIECFVDEVADALAVDSVAFRRGRLTKGDVLDCLELAAAHEQWIEGERRGRGVAVHSYNGTAAAAIATVTVTGGRTSVQRVLVALSCGTVVHPEFVAQQMEGGVAFAMQTLFHPGITFDAGAVVQRQLGDVTFMGMRETPEVEVVIVPSQAPPSGVGEIGVAVAGPAILNAIASATGRRTRRLPFGQAAGA